MTGKVIPFSKTSQEVHPEQGLAKPFFQGWLDDVAEAVMTGDFDRYAGQIHLPFTFKTDRGVMVIAEMEALQDGYDAWRRLLETHSVTEFRRTVVEAAWVKNDVFTGLYETRLISDGQDVMPSFTSLMELTRMSGVWKTTTLVNGMKNVDWPITSPFLVVDGAPNE